MCGEIDESVGVGQDVLERFSVMARMLGVTADMATADMATAAPEALDTQEGREAYMDRLFRAGLTRALSDAAAAEDDQKIDAVAAQAIAFARLAGFIAGQLPPEADLFRAVIEAMSAGHAETGRLAERRRHARADAHGHDHHH